MRARNLPADLIREWARRQTAASAKLEGRALPADYMRSEKVSKFLETRGGKMAFIDAVQAYAKGFMEADPATRREMLEESDDKLRMRMAALDG